MADFQVMGGVPDFYSQILNSARQQLVRQPDGTYAPAPQFGGSTSLDQIYGGILPPSVPKTPLVSRSVNTVPVDSNGNPVVPRVGNNIPSTRETMAEQRSGWRPAVTQGVQPAGTATMPLGARPSNIPPPTSPEATQTAQGTTYFPTGTGQYGYNALTGDYEVMQPGNAYTRGTLPPNTQGNIPQNPALGAIDQATGVPLPRPRPPLPPMPFMPSPMLRSALSPTREMLPGATNFDGSPVQVLVPRGGNYTAPPSVPAPRLRASPETFARNRAAAEAALAIDMAGGSTHKTGKYAKTTPRKDRLAARAAKQL